MNKEKIYEVNIDMIWSHTFTVKAKSAAEARNKAFEKFKIKVKKKDFHLSENRID